MDQKLTESLHRYDLLIDTLSLVVKTEELNYCSVSTFWRDNFLKKFQQNLQRITCLRLSSSHLCFPIPSNAIYFPVSVLIVYNLCYPISNDAISVLFLLHPELPDLTSAKVLAQFGWVKCLDLLSLSKKIHLSYCKYVSDLDQMLFTCAAGCCGHFGKLQGIVSWRIGNRQKETKKIFEELGLGNSAITIITVTYIHLLKPKSDQHPNSPGSNTAESFIKIMRLLT